MRTTDVIIIGAGQAGLATSYCLGQRGIDHLVLERGRVAERWRSARWDSLRLLTPNWQSRLPGHVYRGPRPDDFMSKDEVVQLLAQYAERSAAPLLSDTRVRQLARHGAHYRVRTDRGDFHARQVVVATGYCDVAAHPLASRTLRSKALQLAPASYRNPGMLPPGGVLVVGASASGAQLAWELAHAGRAVTLAVGRHTRLPRRYRGADIMWWLDRIGALDETTDDVSDLNAARRQPSLQLTGSDAPGDLDLSRLIQRGVRICGRVVESAHSRVHFADDLSHTVGRAEAKLRRLLQRIDQFVAATPGFDGVPPAERPAQIDLSAERAVRSIDLNRERIGAVIWATGFRRDYSWLHVPVLDAAGEIIHSRGVTPCEGLYAVGLRFQHTRKSSFLDGVAGDAEYITRCICRRLGLRESVAA